MSLRMSTISALTNFYGGISLHAQSHGESFLTLLERKFQRQLSFLVLVHDVLKKFRDAQFIISSHSPILLGYPQAQILSFDEGRIREISYEETASVQIVRRFVNHRNRFLEELFKDSSSLFGEDRN